VNYPLYRLTQYLLQNKYTTSLFVACLGFVYLVFILILILV
jgi:hypothetical protein